MHLISNVNKMYTIHHKNILISGNEDIRMKSYQRLLTFIQEEWQWFLALLKFHSSERNVVVVIVRWQQGENGKEAGEETEGKSGRVYEEGKRWKGNKRRVQRRQDGNRLYFGMEVRWPLWGWLSGELYRHWQYTLNHLVQNPKENCHHNHTPFKLKEIGNIVFSV